jgi:hypothetical protein
VCEGSPQFLSGGDEGVVVINEHLEHGGNLSVVKFVSSGERVLYAILL